MRNQIALAVAVCLATVTQATYTCALRYDKRAYSEWYDFGSNFIYGLYDTPPSTVSDCDRCDSFGNIVAQLHYNVVDLEDQRSFWMNKENITGSRLFEMLTRLLEVYPLFSNFFTTLQSLAGDPVMAGLGVSKVLNIVVDDAVVMDVRTEGFSPLSLYSIVDQFPGSNCK